MSEPRAQYAQQDPLKVAGFWIEIQDVVVAAFSEVSGLRIETELEEYQEGGRNDVVYRLPVRTKYTNIRLKRGWTVTDELWNWYEDAIYGLVKPRDCSIVMCRLGGTEGGPERSNGRGPYQVTELGRINVHQAYPVKWEGPELRADTEAIGFEAIELAHMGFRLERR
ncbi:MAG TPA: phage tail protein [Chloroflexota bacterium]|jgi:phage tail-like protein